jgi:hypothetical protein
MFEDVRNALSAAQTASLPGSEDPKLTVFGSFIVHRRSPKSLMSAAPDFRSFSAMSAPRPVVQKAVADKLKAGRFRPRRWDWAQGPLGHCISRVPASGQRWKLHDLPWMFDPTDISAYGCYVRACKLRQDAELYSRPELLRYGALEVRFSIERYFWEMLDHLNSKLPPKRKRRLWSVGQLRATILGEDPAFIEKLHFVNLLIRADLMPQPNRSILVHVPDLDEFDDHYGKIGGYLHAPKNGEKIAAETAWWEGLRNQLKLAVDLLKPYVHADMVKFDVSTLSRPIFEDYQSGKMNEAEVLAAMTVRN